MKIRQNIDHLDDHVSFLNKIGFLQVYNWCFLYFSDSKDYLRHLKKYRIPGLFPDILIQKIYCGSGICIF